jgi:hypothetical protein
MGARQDGVGNWDLFRGVITSGRESAVRRRKRQVCFARAPPARPPSDITPGPVVRQGSHRPRHGAQIILLRVPELSPFCLHVARADAVGDET